MAKPSVELIAALRETADRLQGGVRHQWGHMGNCNCGHLAQTLTHLAPREIHARAMESVGDWRDQVTEYCPTSRLPFDTIVDSMIRAGLTTSDIADLERLCGDEIIAEIDEARLPLDHRDRDDAILYLQTWADLLERRWRLNFERTTAAERTKTRRRSARTTTAAGE